MSALHKDLNRCYFCEALFTFEKGTEPEDGLYAEQVGEFWNKEKQDSVLAHVDCLPDDADKIILGQHPVWCMA
jgi:hypothetical protein